MHKPPKKTKLCITKIQNAAPRRTPSKTRRDNLQNRRTYLQTIYAIRDVVLKYIKNCYNSIKKTTQWRNGWRIWADLSPKNTWKEPASTEKGAPCHQSSGKCTWIQGDISSQALGWGLSKKMKSIKHWLGSGDNGTLVHGWREWEMV